MIKQIIINLSNRQYEKKKTKSRNLTKPKNPSTHKTFKSFKPHNKPKIIKPNFITIINLFLYLIKTNS